MLHLLLRYVRPVDELQCITLVVRAKTFLLISDSALVQSARIIVLSLTEEDVRLSIPPAGRSDLPFQPRCYPTTMREDKAKTTVRFVQERRSFPGKEEGLPVRETIAPIRGNLPKE